MTKNFWKDKIPCWKLLGCSKYVYPNCIAYKDRSKPCWEHPSTQCGEVLNIPRQCQYCRVYMLYSLTK
ncbi:MAG: hypothetical protein AB1502_05695 [Thermodesulfobacteriota bacterium]